MSDSRKRLVTSRSGHHIFLVEEGARRWVPDLWTLHQLGASPENLEILSDDELAQFILGEAVPSSVPVPPLSQGAYIETESGVYQVMPGGLQRITAVERIAVDDPDFDPSLVAYLPASLLRGFSHVTARTEA